MNTFIPRPCFPPSACGGSIGGGFNPPLGDTPPTKPQPINCPTDIKQCIDQYGKVFTVTRDPNNNCQFFPCNNASVPPPSTGNCKPGFTKSSGQYSQECLQNFQCCLDRNGNCQNCSSGQQCQPSKLPPGVFGDPVQMFNGVMHRWIAMECAGSTPTPTPSSPPTSRPPISRPPICNKRSTSWKYTEETSSLTIEVIALRAKTVSRSRCASTRTPNSSWATGVVGPDGVCRFDACNPSSTGSACKDFIKTVWNQPRGSGTEIFDKDFFVQLPFKKQMIYPISGTRAVNCCPANSGLSGCRDTSKVTGKKILSQNISSSGVVPGFPRQEKIVISAWDKKVYNSVTINGRRTHDVFLYNIEIDLTWRLVHNKKGIVTEFRNDNHECCGKGDNLSFAQTPNRENPRVDEVISMLNSMGFVGAMRLATIGKG